VGSDASFCELLYEALSGTDEFQLARELQHRGRISYRELLLICKERYNIKTDGHVERKASQILQLLRECGPVEIVIGREH